MHSCVSWKDIKSLTPFLYIKIVTNTSSRPYLRGGLLFINVFNPLMTLRNAYWHQIVLRNKKNIYKIMNTRKTVKLGRE